MHKISKACQSLVLLGSLVALGVAIVAWSVKGIFDKTTFMLFYGLLFIIEGASFFNMWPLTEIGFETSEPLSNQVCDCVVGVVVCCERV